MVNNGGGDGSEGNEFETRLALGVWPRLSSSHVACKPYINFLHHDHCSTSTL